MSTNSKRYLRKLRYSAAFALGVDILLSVSSGHAQQNIVNSTIEESDRPVLEGASLEDFFNSAIATSPKLNIAKEQLKIGTARKNAANGQLLPQIRGNASVSDNTRNTSSFRQEFDGNRYSLQLSQILFDWQAFAARSRAYLREDVAEIQYYGELSNLLTDVAEKYFNALQAQDSLNSVASELEAVNNQLQQIEQLYARQLAQITDLYQAQASVASIQSEQVQLRSELEQQYGRLRSVSGVPVGELNLLSEKINIPRLNENLHDWITIAEENNHLIRIRKLELEDATKAISQEKGAYLPQVSLIIQRQDSDVGFDNRPLDRSDNTYIGVDVSVPIYAGGRNRARIQEAKSMKEIATSELLNTQLEIHEKVRAAYLQLKASESIISAATLLLESTTLNATAMQRGFELGAVTSVDLLNALRDQYRSERDLQRVRYDQIKSLLALKREAGQLTVDDLIEVGSWLEAPEPD